MKISSTLFAILIVCTMVGSGFWGAVIGRYTVDHPICFSYTSQTPLELVEGTVHLNFPHIDDPADDGESRYLKLYWLSRLVSDDAEIIPEMIIELFYDAQDKVWVEVSRCHSYLYVPSDTIVYPPSKLDDWQTEAELYRNMPYLQPKDSQNNVLLPNTQYRTRHWVSE